jgi:hypothetical protein
VYVVFSYMNDPTVTKYVESVRKDTLQEIQNMEQYMPELKGILDVWKEFEPAHFDMASKTAVEFVREAAAQVVKTYGTGAGQPDYIRQVAYMARQFAQPKMLEKLKFTLDRTKF